MTREEQLAFCRRCQNRAFDPNQGVVCGKTHAKASFEGSCSNFTEDPAVIVTQSRPVAEEEVPIVEIDQNTFEMLRNYQSLLWAVIGGSLVTLICAIIWAWITIRLQYQVGYMALGVGAVVGYGVRYFGIGVERKFGILGAVFALVGCLVGNLFSQIGFFATEYSLRLLDVLKVLTLEDIESLYTETFHPMDILFYGIAIYMGYRFSFIAMTGKFISKLRRGMEVGEMPAYYRMRLPVSLILGLLIALTCFFASRDKIITQIENYESGERMSQGTTINGIRNGEWYFWNQDGSIAAVGFFKSGERDSLWRWREGGNLKTKGFYRNGLQTGVWETYYPNGKLNDSVLYKTGRQEGKYKRWYENGAVAESGNYELGMAIGRWITYFDNGQIQSEGDMKDDSCIGTWKDYFSDGRLKGEKEYLEDGKLLIRTMYDNAGKALVVNGNGEFREQSDNGTVLIRGEVKSCKPTGKWLTYFEDGKLQEAGYYDGDTYYVNRVWSPKGELLFMNGNGLYKVDYENRKLMQEGAYKGGLKHGVWKLYYPSGVLWTEVSYVEGKKSGMMKNYYESGCIQIEGNMENDEKVGEWRWYHENSNCASFVVFQANKKEGEQKFWNTNGGLFLIETYENGHLINEKYL